MLIEFRVENHRSIRDEQVLTMEAGLLERDDPRLRTVKGHKEKLLPVACLYGANASGKSNVLSALESMRSAVSYSLNISGFEGVLHRNTFAWGKSSSSPSMYELTFVTDGIRFQYGYVVSTTGIDEEWLYAWPNGKQQTWLSREAKSYHFGKMLKGENKLIEEVTRPNALFLSVAASLNHKQLTPLFNWIASLVFRSVFDSTSTIDIVQSFVKSMLRNDSKNSEANQFFQHYKDIVLNADLGILDLRHNPINSDSIEIHHSAKTKDAWLALNEESKGTQTLFRIAYPLASALRYGRVVVIDELESSLHPALARYIVDLFNNPETNPKNAQLIFTTHDTNLLGTTLGEPELRRDEVWLTEKDKDGATVLYPLTDYKPRAGENLERGYLQGRYGAIPFLGKFTPAGE